VLLTATSNEADSPPARRRMRIAMVAACPFPSPQGSQVFVGQMCERLANRGHDVHLVTYGQGREVSDRGYRHHRISRLPGDDARRSGPSVVKPVLDLMLTAALDRVVTEQTIDVMHCHNYEAAVVGLAVRSRRRVPVVYHSHNLMGDELATYFRGNLSRKLAAAAGRLLDSTVPSRADHAIALCEYSRSVLLAHGARRERVSVLPAAVEDEGPAEPRGCTRKRLGLPADAFLVGYCGNLDAYQNLDLLLEAIGLMLRAGRSEVRLVVATHAVDPAWALRLDAHGIADETFTLELGSGYEVARDVLGACDVLALPRRHGSGYPIKLLNYLSAARPVVTAGCGAKVLSDGIDGIVVADDSPSELARALCRIADDPSLGDRLGAAARVRFVSSLTWDHVVPGIEGIYASVIDSGSTGDTARPV